MNHVAFFQGKILMSLISSYQFKTPSLLELMGALVVILLTFPFLNIFNSPATPSFRIF